MHGLSTLAVVLASLAAVNAHPKFARPRTVEIRQAPAPAASAATASTVSAAPKATSTTAATGTAAAPAAASSAPAMNLTDVDILQLYVLKSSNSLKWHQLTYHSALTLEHLESTFYNQGFAKFPDSEFMALGLNTQQVAALKTVANTESTHVTQLTAAISAAGAQPVQQCTYNFGFTTAQAMVTTARVLEAVGISAYLGAAPLVKMPAVLTAAAQIVTVEARHQTFIRTASSAVPVPNAFDTPLGPRAVFTLASAFIQSCPTGSNLNIQAFPSIALQGGGAGIQAGQSLVLADPQQPTGAMFCAFINQGQNMFAPLTTGSCQVPANMTGEVYMMVTKAQTTNDADVLAG
jgi:Ferritin-like domain